MKKGLFAAIFIIFSTVSCSDDDPVPGPGATVYMNLSAGSTRNYEFENIQPPSAPTSYTVVSTNRDTTVNGRQYHVFSNTTTGGAEYYSQTGTNYFTFQALPSGLGDPVENLYLNTAANVNDTWSQNYNLDVNGTPVPVTVTHKIQEKGVAKTVNGVNYTNVIHVTTSVSSFLIPASALITDIHYWYAPNVGLIENTISIDLDFMGVVLDTETRTRLMSSTIL